MLSIELEVGVTAGVDSEIDSEIDAFLDACPTSFAQQTPSWRDVITESGEDRAIFMTCRRDHRLV